MRVQWGGKGVKTHHPTTSVPDYIVEALTAARGGARPIVYCGCDTAVSIKYKENQALSDLVLFGARGGSRTRTPLRALAPEASESTNSTTRASYFVVRRFAQRKRYTTTTLELCQHFFQIFSFSPPFRRIISLPEKYVDRDSRFMIR